MNRTRKGKALSEVQRITVTADSLTKDLLLEIIENLPIGVTITDPDCNIIYTNRADALMHGYEAQEVFGKSAKIFSHPDQWEPTNFENISERHIFSRESLNVDKWGRVFPVQLVSFPIKDTNERMLGFATICEDISRIKEMERKKNKALAEFNRLEHLQSLHQEMRGIVHRLKNQFSIIQSNMELASMKAPENISEHIERTLASIRRGKAVTEQLLYSKPGVEIFQLIAIGDMIRQVVNVIKIENKQISINLKIMPSLWKVYGFPSQVRKAILELLMHATKSLPEQGCDSLIISISLANVVLPKQAVKVRSSIDEFVRLSVSYDNIEMAHIRGGEKTDNKLSMANNIMLAHGGWIEVDSNTGAESAFRAFLPGLAEETDCKPDKAALKGGRETILFVEDERNIAEAAKEMLEYLGYSVFIALSGEEALRIYDEKSGLINMVILDLILPDFRGVEVLKRIRFQKPEIKVIIASALAYESDIASIPGQFEFIAKPYDFDALSQAIKKSFGETEPSGIEIKTTIDRIGIYFKKERTIPYNGHLTDCVAVYNTFSKLAFEPKEKFLAVFLDNQQKIIAYDELAQGTLDNVNVYPHEVARSALLAGAAAIILVHNHPSGSLKPSEEDIKLTMRMKSVCEILNIRLDDHVIISKKGFYSFAKKIL